MKILIENIILESEFFNNSYHDIVSFLYEIDEIEDLNERIELYNKLLKASNLILISSIGTARNVYSIDDIKILKIIKFKNKRELEYSINQFKKESSPIFQSGEFSEYFTRNFETSKNYEWIISEKCQKVTSSTFSKWLLKLGIITNHPHDTVEKIGTILISNNNNFKKRYEFQENNFKKYISKEEYENIISSKLYKLFVFFIKNYGRNLIEDFSYDNIGFSLEDGRPVILDYGF